MTNKKPKAEKSGINFKKRTPGKVKQDYFGDIKLRMAEQINRHPFDEMFPEEIPQSKPEEAPQPIQLAESDNIASTPEPLQPALLDKPASTPKPKPVANTNNSASLLAETPDLLAEK